MELTTVADDHAVVHDDLDTRFYDGLEPDTMYEYDGFVFRTLPHLGALVTRFATVNDVHFGELECGVIEGMDLGPVLSVPDGAEPYPELMNRCAIAEMQQADVAAVVVKGDLTAFGTEDEYRRFLEFYEDAFDERLFHVRGNHDAYHGQTFASDAPFVVDLPGVRLAVLDTAIAGHASGRIGDNQLVWLRDLATEGDTPILVFGHHHVWSPESRERPHGYFGVHPDDSERLIEVVAAHRTILGYFAGHTHRNRVRRFGATGAVPWAEVASVKDFPGAWAEYRVFEHGITQIMHRISDPDALAWTEQTRGMYGGTYDRYSFGELEDRCFVVARW